MPHIRVSATRMELMRVRRRLSTAVRGHAVLKDKLEGLMQEFLQLVERYREARRAFNAEFPELLKRFLLANLTGSAEAVEEALAQGRSRAHLTVAQRNLAGVNVPQLSAEIHSEGGHSLLDTSLEFDEAVRALRDYFPKLLELAELEHSVWLFVAEIQRTRRRVNALEYIMIPDMRAAVKYIAAKLEENARGNTVRLMKIKELRFKTQGNSGRL